MLDHKPRSGRNILGDYKVTYREGVLEAVAYDAEGKELARCSRKSFKDAVSFKTNIDERAYNEAGSDLVFAEISAFDEDGNPVENANNLLKVSVRGGKLLALDNGDSTDYDSYKTDCKHLFNGKLLAIIKKDTSDSENFDSSFVQVEEVKKEIPIRKIALSSEGEKTIRVKAKVYPENATFNDLSFAILNKNGTKSNLAKIVKEFDGNEALIEALGDGEFTVRCEARNGQDHVNVMSTLDFAVDGVGKAYLDPYDFIFGCNYSSFTGKVGSGIEHGVATDRENETVVTYRGIDFGKEGSDTITIPIFPLVQDPIKLEIWENVPGDEDAELLLDAVYDKKIVWNVYQEDTWKLGKKLCGVKTLSIRVYKEMHIKGFSFK